MNELINQLFFPCPPQIIYHYCSAETFLNIIKNKQLWLTDSEMMNDFAEEQWAANLTYQQHMRWCREANSSDFFKSQYHIDYQSTLMRARKFICCFSEDGDSLSQWRAYADNGSGFAIGFYVDKLSALASPPTSALLDDGCYLLRVLYDKDKQLKFINKCLELDSTTENSSIFESSNKLANLAIAMKNPAFSDEREWRIVLTSVMLELDLEDGPNGGCEFRVNKLGLSPYFKFGFSNDAIAKVVCGPLNKSELHDIKLFFEKYGIPSVEVEESGATYRG